MRPSHLVAADALRLARVSEREVTTTGEVSLGGGPWPFKAALARSTTRRWTERGLEALAPAVAAVGEGATKPRSTDGLVEWRSDRRRGLMLGWWAWVIARPRCRGVPRSGPRVAPLSAGWSGRGGGGWVGDAGEQSGPGGLPGPASGRCRVIRRAEDAIRAGTCDQLAADGGGGGLGQVGRRRGWRRRG